MAKPIKISKRFPNARREYTEAAIIELMNYIYQTKQLLPVGMEG
jgi:hypothetical protein